MRILSIPRRTPSINVSLVEAQAKLASARTPKQVRRAKKKLGRTRGRS